MKRSRKMLIVATLLVVASVIAPLFAGYCMNCWTGNCAYFDPACIPRTYFKSESACQACGPVGGYYYCTDCYFDLFWCEKLSNGRWVLCSALPYIFILREERNFRRQWPPYSCVFKDGRYQCQ